MQIHFIFGFIPIPVFFGNILLADWQGGISYGVFVMIRDTYENDVGLIQHELQHCRQFYALLCVVFSFLLFYLSLIPRHYLALNSLGEYVLIWLMAFLITGAVSFAMLKLDNVRLHLEVNAYKQQLAIKPQNIDYYASMLSERYGLAISIEDAKKMLLS